MSQVYDCGGDDYFNVAPAAGTLPGDALEPRTTTASSPRCAEAAPGLRRHHRARTPTRSRRSRPRQPVITGDARVGRDADRRSAGGWTNAPAAYAYQWERGDGLTWIAVARRDRGRPTRVTRRDVGLRLRVRVIATNADGVDAPPTPPSTGPASPTRPRPSRPRLPRSRRPRPPPRAVPNRGRATLQDRARARAAASGSARSTSRSRAAACARSPTRVRLARGRYELRLCTTAGGARCARRTLKVAPHARSRACPALSLGRPRRRHGPRQLHRCARPAAIFSALTAKRPSAGLLLGSVGPRAELDRLRERPAVEELQPRRARDALDLHLVELARLAPRRRVGAAEARRERRCGLARRPHEPGGRARVERRPPPRRPCRTGASRRAGRAA